MKRSEKPDSRDFRDQVRRAAETLAELSAEAAVADPGLRARLDAALRALHGAAPAERHTAILDNPADARAVVRDVVAEELARYWERRFGGTP